MSVNVVYNYVAATFLFGPGHPEDVTRDSDDQCGDGPILAATSPDRKVLNILLQKKKN